MKRTLFVALVLVTAAEVLAAPRSPAVSMDEVARWQGPDGVMLPFTRDEELLEFLRTAEVVRTKVLTSGKNRPLKVRLAQDGIEANAIFRNVDEKKGRIQIEGKDYRDFHDSYRYECAAYEVGRLLGLDNVPPCVAREIGGQPGTLQLWVENARTIKDQVEEGADPLNSRHGNRQRQTMALFDELIQNFDRNQGNMLLDATGKLWLIDHTRSFALTSRVDVSDIVWCRRDVWEKLKALDKGVVKERLRPFAEPRRIDVLLTRRDKLVAHIQSLIDERGEDAVLFDDEPAVTQNREIR